MGSFGRCIYACLRKVENMDCRFSGEEDEGLCLCLVVHGVIIIWMMCSLTSLITHLWLLGLRSTINFSRRTLRYGPPYQLIFHEDGAPAPRTGKGESLNSKPIVSINGI